MRELVSFHSRFRVPVATAFQLSLANWAQRAESGLEDEIKNSAVRFRYGFTAGVHRLRFFFS